MNSEQQVKCHLDQLSKRVCFLDSDFHKVQPLTNDGGPQSGNWGGWQICVEVARKNEQVAIRDSKNPKKGHLLFSNEEWKAFIVGAKAGQFDV